jgi:hypothetical protein
MSLGFLKIKLKIFVKTKNVWIVITQFQKSNSFHCETFKTRI